MIFSTHDPNLKHACIFFSTSKALSSNNKLASNIAQPLSSYGGKLKKGEIIDFGSNNPIEP